MAYDPALVSFILVGLVGGVAAVMSASSGWELSHELARATDTWTAPVVTRSYPNDSSARARISREADVLQGHGYRAVLRREVSGAPAQPDGVPGGLATGGHVTPPVHPPSGTIVITYDRARL